MYGPAMARAQAIDDAAAAAGAAAGGAAGARRRRRRSDQPPAQPPPPPSSRRRVLEGVPLSIKESIDVAGTDSTCGLAARCFKPAAEDALVVRLLIEAGAVPFVKTNVPQSLISFETINNVYGA
jgi:Asp-tRNA(Asn)/Glu-tRNA(Gln) amidotransferase A subunit family amidase